MNQQLQDFYNHLNESVMTTNGYNKNGVLFRKREKVDQFSHCGLNPMYRHYLSFDLDDRCSVYRFAAAVFNGVGVCVFITQA